ncbi:O-methyltransferase [Macleaya cordata]|uniref:O-methyltransferase n=1 Tax=Macleaya cordata TaxID=56857 RepID=A0A200R8B2_MACCD|nr:O-methyltransferase [Macleaya cordata]
MDSSTDNDQQLAKDNELIQAQTHVYNHIFTFISSMSLKCAVQLGIPDIIHNNHGQPITLSGLVNALSLPPTKTAFVYRLMRILVHSGYFATQKIDENQEEEGFLLTSSSRLLLKDSKNTFSSIVLTVVDPVLVTPFFSLSDWFQGINGSTTSFEAAHGMGFWSFLEQHPEYSKTFNDAMANDSRLMIMSSVIVKEGKEVFENLKTLVDVGGGDGTSAKAIAEAFPHLKCLVLDLPHVVADHLSKSATETSFTGGATLRPERVVAPPASSDDDCVKILKRCREAIPLREGGGKVILIEIVMEDKDYNMKLQKQEADDDERTELQLYFDMMMMTTFDGKERNEKEWEKLFIESGFSDYKITPVSGFRSLIEVYP